MLLVLLWPSSHLVNAQTLGCIILRSLVDLYQWCGGVNRLYSSGRHLGLWSSLKLTPPVPCIAHSIVFCVLWEISLNKFIKATTSNNKLHVPWCWRCHRLVAGTRSVRSQVVLGYYPCHWLHADSPTWSIQEWCPPDHMNCTHTHLTKRSFINILQVFIKFNSNVKTIPV